MQEPFFTFISQSETIFRSHFSHLLANQKQFFRSHFSHLLANQKQFIRSHFSHLLANQKQFFWGPFFTFISQSETIFQGPFFTFSSQSETVWCQIKTKQWMSWGEGWALINRFNPVTFFVPVSCQDLDFQRHGLLSELRSEVIESVGWNWLKFWYLLQWIYSNTLPKKWEN